jgi:hypothetical protein
MCCFWSVQYVVYCLLPDGTLFLVCLDCLSTSNSDIGNFQFKRFDFRLIREDSWVHPATFWLR